jgi:general stress protein YciG
MADQDNKRGRGNFGNKEQHAAAGRRGGQATARTHGSQFYSEIGAEGGKRSSGSFQKGSTRAQEAGRRGGQARRNKTSSV